MKKEDTAEFPDQSLFEPDEEFDGKKTPLWRKMFVALFFILTIPSVLYLTGVYHLNFLAPTPDTATERLHEAVVQGDIITLPLSFVIVESEETGAPASEDRINQLIGNSNAIWNQALIRFTLENVETVEVKREDASQFLKNPTLIRDRFERSSESGITVYLLDTLAGLNGIAYTGLDIIGVARYTSYTDYRTLSHEIGHILGLGHVEDPSLLMDSGATGTMLTQAEALDARTRAMQLIESGS